jgi:hypothetical protein
MLPAKGVDIREVTGMADTELLLSLAEIAGVFVGFGALIAVRSAGPSQALEVAPVRGVVLAGMMVIVAALAPLTLGRYDLSGHQVLALSSVLVLITYAGLILVHRQAPEYTEVASSLGRSGRFAVARDAVETVAFVLVVGIPTVALLVIAVGLLPELEAALYFTAVVLFLVQAAWTLLWLVFMERRPAGVGPG